MNAFQYYIIALNELSFILADHARGPPVKAPSLWQRLAWRRPRPRPRLALYAVHDGTGQQSPLGIAHLLLLVASWARYIAPDGDCPLVIRALRARNERLLARIEAMGARVEPVDKPHRLSRYSVTYNKLLGLMDQREDEARLLLDTDVAFVSGIGPLKAEALDFVMADFADRQRVPPAVIAELRSALALELPQGAWRPLKECYDAMVAREEPPVYQDMYFSSGVVASPLNSALPATWERHAERISLQFKDRYDGQKQRQAFGSDQLGLATACRVQPRFKLLPAGYNYRMFGFQCGHLPLDRIHLVHHVGSRRAHSALPPERRASLPAIIQYYYDEFIIKPVLADGLPEREARAAIAHGARDRILAVIRELDIGDLGEVGG